MDFLIKLLASGFCLGYLPYAPGTFGTLGGVALFLLFSLFSPLQYLIATVALFFIAVVIASKAEIIFGKSDAEVIVIDEIVGFLITMALIKPSLLTVTVGFILFRFFDIVKIWPASYFNNKHGGFAVVTDDVAAGVYANIILRITIYYFPSMLHSAAI